MQQLIDDLVAVRADGVPSVRRRARRRHLLVGAGVAFAALGLALLLPWMAGLRAAAPATWSTNPALNGLGIDRENVHAGSAATEDLVRRALLADARGDLSEAVALLESAHASDSRSPVPALLIAYWRSTSMAPPERERWLADARARIARADDAYLELLARFIAADTSADYGAAMRYSGALLDLKPHAWFLRLARSHFLKDSNLREAALRELQQITAPSLGHRKLVDAIADRASFGDLAGARALADQLATPMDDPNRAMLEARLAWTAGDLDAAARHLETAIRGARAIAQFEIESRALLLLGLVHGSLGRAALAETTLREARQRLLARNAVNTAVEASLVLAQLAALTGDRDEVQREIAQARELRTRQGATDVNPLIEIYAARLLGVRPTPPARDLFAAVPLVQAWAALIDGDRDAARLALARADEGGVLIARYAEESLLLRRALGETEPALPPYDPPFQPFSRCASRWALGMSIVGEPPAWPAGKTGP